MEIRVIGNAEAVLGFSLVGVHGHAVATAEEAGRELDQALAAPGVGIILVTEDVADWMTERIEQLKMRSTVPLVVEIPGPAGEQPGRPSLEEVVFRAIGVKI